MQTAPVEHHASKQSPQHAVVNNRSMICSSLQGVWKPALIANPAYYKDEMPLANIGKIDAVAIEIWTMDSGFFFDDIVVANDPSLAAEFREKTYGPKKATEVCFCAL